MSVENASARISVIVITHNNAQHVERCLESMLSQTLRPFEIIVCDDASTDDTCTIIDTWAARYPDIIRLIKHPLNQGIPANLNSGFRVAKGDYVSLIAGDDIWLPEKLEKEYLRLCETGAAWAYSKVVMYWDDLDNPTRTADFWGTEPGFEGNVFEKVLRREMSLRNYLVRREAMESLGFFDENIGMYEDWDFNIRMSHAYPISYVPEANVVYLIHGGGEHHAPMYRHMAEVGKILRKNAELLPGRMAEVGRETIQRFWPEDVMQSERDKAAYRITLDSLDLPWSPARVRPDGEGLVFLVSLQRSGSTMLQRVLGCHPDIHTTAEPWLMLHPLYQLKEEGVTTEFDANLGRQAVVEFLGQLPGSEENYYDAVRQMASVMYSRAVRFSGKSRFLDKTPRYFRILPELLRTFPKAKVILLLRNPLAVLASVLDSWFEGDVERFGRTAHSRDLLEGPALMAQAMRDFGDRIHVMRYEDLVTDSWREVQRLCDYLGIPPYRPMLNYGDVPAPEGSFGDAFRVHHHKGPVEDYLYKWVSTLEEFGLIPYAHQYVEAVGEQVFSELGYPLQSQGLNGFAIESVQAKAEKACEEGEALFHDGDTDGARKKFELSLSLDKNFVLAYNNLAVLHWHLNRPEETVIALSEGLSRQPKNRDLVMTAGQVFTALDMPAEAQSLLAGYLADFPDDTEVQALYENIRSGSGQYGIHDRAVDSPDPRKPVASGPIAVITSIAPGRVEVQQRAVQSWLDHGFEVMSLNVQSEIDRLVADFPEVRFIPAKRNGRKRLGKPYVYIGEMLSALRQSGRQVVGIINSDIILRAGDGLSKLLYQEVGGSLLYGSRIDIEHLDDTRGRYYHRGYDLFFMGQDVISGLDDNTFMLGVPWWDYWFPCLMHARGVELKCIKNPGAYHLWHEPNYSSGMSVSFGDEFVKAFPGAAFLRLYEQSVSSGSGAFRYSVLSESVLYHVARNSRVVSLPGNADRPAESEQRGPRVTAIVSTYASEEFIGECLHDLVNQTIADEIEIIVIDAASPQNERAVVERFQKKHPNIIYHRTPERIGIYAAWNLAVRMASGEYLISCSTNDRLRGDACEILARALDDQPDLGLVYGNSFLTKTPHQTFDNVDPCDVYIWPEYRYETLLDRSMVGPHPMWRRSVHERVGYFDESLVALGDQDFWIRVGAQYELLALPDFTGIYLVSEDSLTGNTDLTRVEEDRVHTYWGWRYRYGKWYHQRLEAPRQLHSNSGPTALVVVQLGSADMDAVADTLDSLTEQVYANWKLVVLADRECPDPLFQEHPQLHWTGPDAGGGFADCIDTLLEDAGAEANVLFMQAGERLDALFLSDACAMLERHPEWQVLYCDDDRVSSDGELYAPRFKPDFNLELLRASDYIGHACLFRSQAVRVVGGAGRLDRARVFDLLLRVYDHFGREVIGHLSDIRFHRCSTDEDYAAESVEQRRHALGSHLERCDEAASVEDATISGCFMLNYDAGSRPGVSILIAATGSGEAVSHAVQSILSQTAYPDYEIRILLGPEVPPAVVSRLEAWRKNGVALHIRRCTHPSSPEQLNRLAREADGELLLWLGENTFVLQQHWLDRLVSTWQRDTVGVVGARLITQKKILLGAGVITGVGSRGAGSRMHVGLHMTSEGYMGRAQLAQETGAVPAQCMLVGKEQFEALGGFDRALSIDLYRDIDFCQRVRSIGQQVIWTPHVTLMYAGNTNTIDGVPGSEKQVERETALLHQRWLDYFAHEPAYNRHLSLSRNDFGLDTRLSPVWNPELDEQPRIVSFGVGSYGSWQYRVRQPLDALQAEGAILRLHTELAGKACAELPTVIDLERLQPTSLLMHNTLHDDYIEALAKYKRVNNAFIVFGQDDLMQALPPKNPFAKTVYKDIKKRVRKCLSLADRLVVTTEPLAQALGSMVDEVWVVPNYLDESVWGGLESRRSAGPKPRVGWAGAQQHLGDLELLEQVVRETADEVDWVFFGMCPRFLRPYAKEVHDAVEFERYPEKLAGLNLDLAVAPLEHNRFNESKSNLRLLEYGALGWAVIASDIHPYRDAPVCRVPNQARAWIQAIRERTHDLEATWREGDRLREWVRSGWFLQQNTGQWLAALDPASGPVPQQRSGNRVAGL